MTIVANVFGEIEVTDWILASLISYSGYPIFRCTSDGGNQNTTWVFKNVPSEDLKILEEEVTRYDTSVMLLPFLSALKTVQEVQKRAKRNMGMFSSNTGFYSQQEAAAS